MKATSLRNFITTEFGENIMTTLATRLVYSDAKSNKEYNVAIEQKGEGYVVNFAYGRVGGSLKSGTK